MTAPVQDLAEEQDFEHELLPQQWRKTVVQTEVDENEYNTDHHEHLPSSRWGRNRLNPEI